MRCVSPVQTRACWNTTKGLFLVAFPFKLVCDASQVRPLSCLPRHLAAVLRLTSVLRCIENPLMHLLSLQGAC